jgi:hypothetical protein
MLVTSQYHKNWEFKNPDSFKRAQDTRKRRRRNLIWYFRNRPCLDCHGIFDTWQREFDHTRGTKKFNVTSGFTRPIKELLKEIAKCDVVCANCHKSRTYKRNQQSHHFPPDFDRGGY